MQVALVPSRRLTAVLIVLVAFVVGAASWGHAVENALGLFYDPDAAIDEIDISPNTTHTLYIVLVNPVNLDYGGGGSRAVDFVWGFECGIEPPSGDILLGLSFPTPTVNVGSIDNIVAGFAHAIPVGYQRAATLGSLNVLTRGNNPTGYRLVPARPASHPNTMAYVDYEDPDDNLVDMEPISGSHDRPVFTFGDYTTEEGVRWGEVKSLFR